jgi:hypothetical protein
MYTSGMKSNFKIIHLKLHFKIIATPFTLISAEFDFTPISKNIIKAKEIYYESSDDGR